MRSARMYSGARSWNWRRNGVNRHRGAALIVTLLMMMALLMLGMSAFQSAWQGEKAGRGDRDRLVAFQAAEAALMDAQRDIDVSPRREIFVQGAVDAFGDACDNRGTELHLGLCKESDPAGAPVWADVNFVDVKQNRSVPYGYFTGQQFQNGVGVMPARLPRYIIERFSRTGGEDSAPMVFYRITALGFGMRETTQVMLQSFYRPDHADGSPGPKGRFGWREISNWREVRSARSSG
ncbi:MAG TPA: PilX N-terminal domain-containing pilus assembly protein [Noviherbaspirillum sp.]|nr:PilX N-terminal domain-containing pilus assembly protein [Noviherbaspirillum sp.]